MFYYYFGGKLPKENVLCDQDSYFTWNALLRYITIGYMSYVKSENMKMLAM